MSEPTVNSPVPSQPTSGTVPPTHPGEGPRTLAQPTPSTAAQPSGPTGIPTWAIIGAGLCAAVVVAMSMMADAVLFGIALIPTLAVFGVGLAAYLWVDRWDPEPRRSVIFALLWGGGVATLGSIIVGQTVTGLGILDLITANVIAPPFIEEALKGLFLVLMLTGARRVRMTTLTNFLVYAGLVGLGFMLVENLLYLARQGSVENMFSLVFLRLGMGAYVHSFFTTATAVGLYLATTRATTTGKRVLYGLGGYVIGSLLHVIWNGSMLFGEIGFLIAYFVVMVPLFVWLVRTAIRCRRSEGAAVAGQLPLMVNEGLVTQPDADWLQTLPARRTHFAAAKKGGAQAVARERAFAGSVTELAVAHTAEAQGRTRPAGSPSEAALVAAVRGYRAPASPQHPPTTH